MILIFLVAAFVVFTFFGWEGGARAEKLKQENAELKTRLDVAEQESARQQAMSNHLLEVEAKAGIWDRPCKVEGTPPMPSKDSRRTRFLTVLNFKGGVGKITLAANLAACLSLEKTGSRVLLLDTDFQGTLGAATVDRAVVEAQARHESFVNRLLVEEPNDRLPAQLMVQMQLVPGVDVILATDTLSVTDFQLQAQ